MKKYILFIKGFVVYFGLQCLLYFCSKFLQGEPNLIHHVIDDKIPFVSFFVVFYCLWYLYLLLIPLMLYKKDQKKLNVLFWSLVISIIFANIIFVAYPSTVIRATITGSSIFDYLVKIIYFFDNPPVNCLPSLHCLFSFFFIYATFNNNNVSRKNQIFILITNILIVLSTMFIKQHAFHDALLALIISIPIWLISKNIKINYLQLLKKRR